MTGRQDATTRLFIAGFGGQGALLAGLTLARTGMELYEHVAWFPQYGGAMRGGDANCTVVFSQEKIFCPWRARPDACILMHRMALDEFEQATVPNGILLVDSSLAGREVERDDVRVLAVPATEIAMELGSRQVANFVLLGAYVEASKVVPVDKTESTLETIMREDAKEKFLDLNLKALRRGVQEGTKGS